MQRNQPVRRRGRGNAPDDETMKLKTVLTVALLAFVATSLFVLAAQEVRRHWRAVDASAARVEQAKSLPPLSDGLIVYCFHRTVRCPTCLGIEAYTKEALRSGFADRLDQGRIQCRVVDIEQPDNEHFRDDYQLIGPSVVLVEMHGGIATKWENLVDVVSLLDRKPQFVEYVRQHVQTLLISTPASGRAP